MIVKEYILILVVSGDNPSSNGTTMKISNDDTRFIFIFRYDNILFMNTNDTIANIKDNILENKIFINILFVQKVVIDKNVFKRIKYKGGCISNEVRYIIC